MNLTSEEKLMFNIMRAIYESGIPISFKGSMVLRAYLMEMGYSEEMRHTVDIDANWNMDAQPTMIEMQESINRALRKSGYKLDVETYRDYQASRSAGFEIKDSETKEVLFTMDVDVNRPMPITKMYEIGNIKFSGASPIQMIADKIYVLSTDNIFRRVKDLVDLYYLSKVFQFKKKDVIMALNNSGRKLDSFDGFLNRRDELKYAYEKFRFVGDVSKPSFEEVYKIVKNYINELLKKGEK